MESIERAAKDLTDPQSRDMRNMAQRMDLGFIDLLGWVCDEIAEVLYRSPILVVPKGDPAAIKDPEATAERFLVEFVAVHNLTELKNYLQQTLGEYLEKGGPWPEHITDFLTAWLTRMARDGADGSRRQLDDENYPVSIENTANMDAAIKQWGDRLTKLLEDYESRLTQTRQAAVAEAAADRATRSANRAAEAAGVTGTLTVATFFGELAESERKAAGFWSAVVVLGVGLTVAVAALVLRWQAADSRADQLVHLALTLPLAALSGYAAKLSAHHRSRWWWAQATAVQLKSVGAFVERLSQDQAALVMQEVGLRVFGSPELDKATKIDDASILAVATQVLDRINPTSEK